MSVIRRRNTRNIPAHAGKTGDVQVWDISRQEHPRARGENPPGTLTGLFSTGTSPRTRGKRSPYRGRFAHPGNIPAHAGKTTNVWLGLHFPAEHPRARGENNVGKVMVVTSVGTSPRTRGKHDQSELLHLWHGNIPAHAGKTGTPPAARG